MPEIPDEVMDAFATAASIVDQLTDTGFAGTAVEALGLHKEFGSQKSYAVNPHFVQNGHATSNDGGSKVVKRYFRWRRLKKIGGGVVSLAGTAGSSVTQINVGSTARHGVSEAKTLSHLYHLKNMSKQVKQSEFLSRMIATCIIMKQTKAICRGGQLASALIPNAIVSGALGTVAGVAGRYKVKRMTGPVAWTAMEMHWRAKQELALSGTFGGTGPAMRMVYEIFNKTCHIGNQNLDKPNSYIEAPDGWLTIQDKLNLM